MASLKFGENGRLEVCTRTLVTFSVALVFKIMITKNDEIQCNEDDYAELC